MKIAVCKIALCMTLGTCATCAAFASETVELACPSPQYSVDPEISVTTARVKDGYTYNYQVTYRITGDAMATFVIPPGLEDFEITSWSGDFKRCWKSSPSSTQSGFALACEPGMLRPGETWAGNVILVSKASPGAWKYYVSSMHYRTADEKQSPRIENYLKSSEGDEAFQEAALERCGYSKEWQPFASTIMTGALLAPTDVPGISPEAVQRASRSDVNERVRQMLGTNRTIGNSAMSAVKLQSSGGRSFSPLGTSGSATAAHGPDVLHCYERGIFAEVLEDGQVKARQGWQVEAAPDCGAHKTFSLEVP